MVTKSSNQTCQLLISAISSLLSLVFCFAVLVAVISVLSASIASAPRTRQVRPPAQSELSTLLEAARQSPQVSPLACVNAHFSC